MWSDGPAVGGGRHFVTLGARATNRVSCPKTVLFESRQGVLLGKRSLNNSKKPCKRDSGQGRVLGRLTIAVVRWAATDKRRYRENCSSPCEGRSCPRKPGKVAGRYFPASGTLVCRSGGLVLFLKLAEFAPALILFGLGWVGIFFALEPKAEPIDVSLLGYHSFPWPLQKMVSIPHRNETTALIRERRVKPACCKE
jgi:hypothetical protein